jgi:hypothetical protein
MTVTERARTAAEWSQVISDLAAKQRLANEHAAELRQRKSELALASSLGEESAKKELVSITRELTRIAAEGDDYALALAQAETEKQKASVVEAEAAERERMAAMGVIAQRVIDHAAKFTAHLRSAVVSGRAVKEAAGEMLALAKPEERARIDKLLQPHAYMRCAEFAGLRDHLEFQGYPGPREHLVELEQELAVHLRAWLKDGKEN